MWASGSDGRLQIANWGFSIYKLQSAIEQLIDHPAILPKIRALLGD
jgi:hypothetical protein